MLLLGSTIAFFHYAPSNSPFTTWRANGTPWDDAVPDTSSSQVRWVTKSTRYIKICQWNTTTRVIRTLYASVYREGEKRTCNIFLQKESSPFINSLLKHHNIPATGIACKKCPIIEIKIEGLAIRKQENNTEETTYIYDTLLIYATQIGVRPKNGFLGLWPKNGTKLMLVESSKQLCDEMAECYAVSKGVQRAGTPFWALIRPVFRRAK